MKNPESSTARTRTDTERDKERIRAYLSIAGSTGATCDEMERELGLSHQTCSARCSDMLNRDETIIRKPCSKTRYEKRPTRTGAPAAVLVLAKYGPPAVVKPVFVDPRQMSLAI